MSSTIYDLQSTQVDELIRVADAERVGDLARYSGIGTMLQSIIGSFKAIMAPQQAVISGGVASVERFALVNYIQIDTEGSALSIDDCDTLSFLGTGAANIGDKYIFFLKSAARQVNFTSTGNFRVKNESYTLTDLDSMIEFTVGPSLNLIETSRYPQIDTADTSPSSASVYVASNAILAQARILSIIALTGETLAQGSITIDPGSAYPGTVTAWIDEGLGAIQIGQYTAILGDVEQDISDGLAASINLSGTYTASSVAGAVCQVTARPNTGSTANSYTLFATYEGSITATITDAMGALVLGVDGSQTDEDIDTLTGGEDGPYYLRNGMATNVLTLIAGGNFTGSALPLALAAGDFVEVLKFGTNISITV